MHVSNTYHAVMANLIFDHQDGVIRSTSDAQPTHYVIKIDNFSLLTKNSIDRYETSEFYAGGHKWKLILHPNGNKSKNVKDHISLYLALAETSLLLPGWEVSAVFRFFLLDQNKDSYLAIEEDPIGNGRRFHSMKSEWGFDQFISLKAFNDASNGYVVDDSCVIGAEVFVCKEKVTGKGERLSMIKEGITYKHTWKIENYSKLEADCNESITFGAGNHKWKLQIHPKGTGQGSGSHVSLFLALDDPTSIVAGVKIYAEYKLSIIDQLSGKNLSAKASHWFSSWRALGGWARYIPQSYFNQTSVGYLMKNTCCIEVEVTVLGQANPL